MIKIYRGRQFLSSSAVIFHLLPVIRAMMRGKGHNRTSTKKGYN